MPSRVRTLLSLIDEAYKTALILSQAHVYDENGAPTEYEASDALVDLPSLPCVGLRGAYVPDGQEPDTYVDTRLNASSPRFWRTDIEKWLSNIGWKEARYFVRRQKFQEKPLDVRERETLLKLVIGMAIGGYGHDATAKKTDTASRIVEDVERQGLSVSDETVRKYLKEAATLLPGRTRKE